MIVPMGGVTISKTPDHPSHSDAVTSGLDASRSRASGTRLAETEGLSHRLGRAVNGALALAALEEAAVVLQGRVDVTAAGNELVKLERLVLDRLVHDRRIVDGLVDRDGGL